MESIVKIKHIEQLTHDVKRFLCEKPDGYSFNPGQATEVAINKAAWRKEKRPFTFTSLNNSGDLEFIIKIYNDHHGVTNKLNELVIGEELIIGDVWGAVTYSSAGYFIAGGAGITPFIAIFRQLHKDKKLAGNKLFFSNKTEQDIILKSELIEMLGNDAVFVNTETSSNHLNSGYIDESFLEKHIQDFTRHFYLCGPPKMVASLNDILTNFGAAPEEVVFEK